MPQKNDFSAKRLKERVRETFSDATALKYAPEYLELIQANSANADKETGRMALLIFMVMFLFELITRASVQEATIGPLKVTDFSFIHRLLPVAVAYYYLELATTFVRAEVLTKVHRYLLAVLYPPVVKNKLEDFIVSTPSIAEVNYLANDGRMGFIQFIIMLIIWILIIVVAPIGFLAYAYYHLFTLFNVSDVLTWVSLVVSIMFTCQGYLTVLNYLSFWE